jgi:hypothetical protein
VTHRAAAYHQSIRALPAILVALVLAACGAQQRSTLPPAPGPAGAIALRLLAHHPEVYSDAQVRTTGTLEPVRVGHRRLYALTGGGGGARIVVEPSSLAAPHSGRHVRVRGVFVVSFQDGYEILASQVTPLSD